ncbi:peptidase [Sphingomonas ginkgonis]|uniref:Peptidase n=1 Tax=Sphingomonas ginkgonis TaxID=2315330 RepID=A0A429V9B4_9SPHN|nr:prepilin peptidase [Sphingomonas ginkgonis]RST30505.1 peptidase [Sphingomonas ginkgonis]
MMNIGFTDLLILALAATLLFAAVVDCRTFTISNWLNLGVALGAPVFWWAAGLPLHEIAWQVAFAAGVFVLLALAFYAGMMGGGDVKLAAALALWFSPPATIRFLVLMSIAGGVLTLLVLLVHRARGKEGKPEIPYGVAIAVGGLLILAQRIFNQFA